MKLLRCKSCRGEMDVIGNEYSINKKIKCLKCGFTNVGELEQNGPEIFVIRKKSAN